MAFNMQDMIIDLSADDRAVVQYRAVLGVNQRAQQQFLGQPIANYAHFDVHAPKPSYLLFARMQISRACSIVSCVALIETLRSMKTPIGTSTRTLSALTQRLCSNKFE